MATNIEGWLTRAKALTSPGARNEPELIQFATSFLTAIYGSNSAQVSALATSLAQAAKPSTHPIAAISFQSMSAHGAIVNTIAEIEGGLIVSLRAQVAGEILGELVRSGKEILEDGTDSAKNVSAVLIAAAFEDLIRRMELELAGVTHRPKLEEVVTALKNAGALKGGEVGIAQSYLKFRNDSLHADWTNVQDSQVRSCIAFIETLLMKHFS